MISFQNVVPLITLDSLTSLFSAGVISTVGIYLARSFLSFKDSVTKELVAIKTELVGIDNKGGMKYEINELREYKHRIAELETRIEACEIVIKDHEARIRTLVERA